MAEQETKQKALLLPLQIHFKERHLNMDFVEIADRNAVPICSNLLIAKDKAEYIVKACNSYDKLVEAIAGCL